MKKHYKSGLFLTDLLPGPNIPLALTKESKCRLKLLKASLQQKVWERGEKVGAVMGLERMWKEEGLPWISVRK